MDVFYTYTYSTAGWLSLQALPLLLAPKLITTILSSEGHHTSELEVYFSRCLGFSLLLMALVMMFMTGSIPLSSSVTEPISMEDSDPKAPYAVPLVRITTMFHGVCFVYNYVRYVNSGQIGFALGAVGYGMVGATGLWCILFATTKGRVSKRTGADKRASGWPFKNSHAYNPKLDRKAI